jgi:glycosyltransferase involved in cell wall biosynthesis
VAFAIEALTALPDEATLVIAGGGDAEHQAELRALTDRLGLQQRVTFRGPVDDTAAVYAQADALVFPVTWDEPFGLVPLEAMASGRPVVATGTGGSGEYLRDGENSLLVTPGDAGAIAGAVRRLADDEPLRAQLVTAGLETARGIPQTAFNEEMLRLAQDVVSGDGRAARADR